MEKINTKSIKPDNHKMDSKQAYKALFAIMIVTLLSVVGIALPYPILAPLFLDPGLNNLNSFGGIEGKLLLAFALSAYPFGMLLGSSFIGTLSDHFGRKKTLLFSGLCSSIGYGLSAWALFSLNFPLLLLSRFLTGLCEGNIAIGRAIATDLHPVIDKTRSFSWLYAVSYGGWLIGPMIGGYTMVFGAHTAFLIAGLSALLACTAVFLWIPGVAKSTDSSQYNSQRTSNDRSGSRAYDKPKTRLIDVMKMAVKQNSFLLIKDKKIKPIFFMYLLLTLGLNAFYQFFPVWLVEDYAFSSTDIAHATALQTIAMVLVSLLVVERVKKLIGIESTIFTGLSLLILSLGSIYFVPEYATLPFFLFTGSFIAMYNGLIPVLISDKFSGEQQGRLMGLLMSTFSLAAMLIAPIGGLISIIGAKFSIMFGAFLLLTGAVYLRWILSSSGSPHCEQQKVKPKQTDAKPESLSESEAELSQPL